MVGSDSAWLEGMTHPSKGKHIPFRLEVPGVVVRDPVVAEFRNRVVDHMVAAYSDPTQAGLWMSEVESNSAQATGVWFQDYRDASATISVDIDRDKIREEFTTWLTQQES